jgi:hypothetical protein
MSLLLPPFKHKRSSNKKLNICIDLCSQSSETSFVVTSTTNDISPKHSVSVHSASPTAEPHSPNSTLSPYSIQDNECFTPLHSSVTDSEIPDFKPPVKFAESDNFNASAENSYPESIFQSPPIKINTTTIIPQPLFKRRIWADSRIPPSRPVTPASDTDNQEHDPPSSPVAKRSRIESSMILHWTESQEFTQLIQSQINNDDLIQT